MQEYILPLLSITATVMFPTNGMPDIATFARELESYFIRSIFNGIFMVTFVPLIAAFIVTNPE